MKKSVMIAVLGIALLSCESGNKQPVVGTEDRIADTMADIDEMVNLEKIVADSSLMDAQGDVSWHPINDKMIRIKKGDKYYLRMQTEKETVTSVTYRYDDYNNNK